MKVGFARPLIAAVCGGVHSNYVLRFNCMGKEDKAINTWLHTFLLTLNCRCLNKFHQTCLLYVCTVIPLLKSDPANEDFFRCFLDSANVY